MFLADPEFYTTVVSFLVYSGDPIARLYLSMMCEKEGLFCNVIFCAEQFTCGCLCCLQCSSPVVFCPWGSVPLCALLFISLSSLPHTVPKRNPCFAQPLFYFPWLLHIQLHALINLPNSSCQATSFPFYWFLLKFHLFHQALCSATQLISSFCLHCVETIDYKPKGCYMEQGAEWLGHRLWSQRTLGSYSGSTTCYLWDTEQVI